MFTKTNEKITLLKYWTTRYLATLCIGLLVIGILSVLWIRHSTLQHRLDIAKFLAEETADRFVSNIGGEPTPREKGGKILRDHDKTLGLEKPFIYIVNNDGDILSSSIPIRDDDRMSFRFPPSILQSKKEIQKVHASNDDIFYAVKAPIKSNNVQLGSVILLMAEKDLVKVNEEYRLLGIMLVSLALLGWLAIYLLTRRLSRPIQDVAKAAKQVQEGNYDIQLHHEVKEKEVHELVSSFKEMTSRLETLESLRAELLAGVTHELKTPVTSISGLLQAVKDDIVEGEEAKEFLAISLKEVGRMQKMVADLLEFNSFSANALPVTLEPHDINSVVKEIVYQWQVTQEDEEIKIDLHLQDQSQQVMVDTTRLQQIFINLLNNAKQAMEEEKRIDITIHPLVQGEIAIDVRDRGIGIPEAEQAYVFERFFRGEGKKFKVRGLGLGLAFSKMIAKAMNGDLFLKETSTEGTTFTLIISATNAPQ